jgi:hypothetical protein
LPVAVPGRKEGNFQVSALSMACEASVAVQQNTLLLDISLVLGFVSLGFLQQSLHSKRENIIYGETSSV